MGSHSLINLAEPVHLSDAVTKSYVDNKTDYKHSQISDFVEGVKLIKMDQFSPPENNMNFNN